MWTFDPSISIGWAIVQWFVLPSWARLDCRHCSLRTYFNTHSGEKSTKCDQCAYASTKKDSLKIHGGETWNKYASLHAYNLRVILKTHNTEHLCKCKHCDFTLSGPSTLRRLLETNCGQNTNSCNQCKYASYQTGNLRTNMKL